ncbi:MAG TPA: CarD family transcriptional regulator [Blastocatellia bacterium]|nr:CarD family transcriptional regulator [Blastocatellia bacterium]
MEFKPGQKVVYPNHGIAIVEQIETRQINGEQHEFYLLRVRENNSLVMVPRRNADEIGLRKPIAGSQCETLLQTLARDFAAPPSDWKNRFKEFSDKMRSGDLFAVAEVLKTLTWLNQLKPLSFREKRMLERARYLVISELACVCRQSEAKVEPKVDAALRGACDQHAQSFTQTAASHTGH